jgi:hypothetical protein
VSTILDGIKARFHSVPESKIKTLSPGLQTLLRSDMPALISIAETVCNYIEFVKSPAPVDQGHVFLDEMSAWVKVLRQRKNSPRQIPTAKLRVLSD